MEAHAKKILVIIGIILLVGLALAGGTQILANMDAIKIKPIATTDTTLNAVGITTPVISDLECLGNTCKVWIKQEGAINDFVMFETNTNDANQMKLDADKAIQKRLNEISTALANKVNPVTTIVPVERFCKEYFKECKEYNTYPVIECNEWKSEEPICLEYEKDPVYMCKEWKDEEEITCLEYEKDLVFVCKEWQEQKEPVCLDWIQPKECLEFNKETGVCDKWGYDLNCLTYAEPKCLIWSNNENDKAKQ